MIDALTKQKHARDLPLYLKISDGTIVEARKLVQGVKVTRQTSPQKQLSMLTLNSLLERADSTSALAHAGEPAGIEDVARGAFENYIDLKNLHRYPKEYPKYMMYLSEKQTLSGLRAIRTNPDKAYAKKIIEGLPVHIDMTVDQAYELSHSDVAMFRSQLTRNYFRKGRHHSDPNAAVIESVYFRAKLADEIDIYRSAYKILSSHSHGNVSSMLGSVVRDMKIGWPPEKRMVSIMSVSLVTGTLLEGSLLVAKKLRKPLAALKMLEAERGSLPS